MALALKRQGITKVRPLAGGLQGWLELGYPVVASSLRTEVKPVEITVLNQKG